jgi:hypothetical protein
MEKVILRWRRKGSGLRGFKSETVSEGTVVQGASSSTEDDYDFLKEGRKQTEKRLEKALARVKSMAQYPDARDQYHRLLNVVTEIQENQVCMCFKKSVFLVTSCGISLVLNLFIFHFCAILHEIFTRLPIFICSIQNTKIRA